MSNLWSRSSRSHDNGDWTPIEGDTPEEIGQNFGKTVDTTGMTESEALQTMLEDAEEWSDNQLEQGRYLFGLKKGLER